MNMHAPVAGNAATLSAFIGRLGATDLTQDVTDAAKQSLIDWFAACLAASNDTESGLVAESVRTMRSQGNAVAIDGTIGSAGPIALLNGTWSHAMEYDDFHIAAVLHVGGATFAACLALAMDRGFSGRDVLRAFVAGFEVSTRLAMNDVGLTMANAGWHATCVLGHISSAAACASLLRLDNKRTEQALGFAAAQVSGFQTSSGTIAKPLQIGKAAFAGLLAADLAERGAAAPQHFLEPGKNSIFSLMSRNGEAPWIDRLDTDWEVLRNTFKPYSSCQCTHAPIDAAKAMRAQITPAEIQSVRITVNPFNIEIAGRENPATPLHCKFSIKHCVAMALFGYGCTPEDFAPDRIADPAIIQLRERIELVPSDSLPRTAAGIEVALRDGSHRRETVEAALGSLERPMSITDTERKFSECAGAALGARAGDLLDALRRFEEQGAIEDVAALLKDAGARRAT